MMGTIFREAGQTLRTLALSLTEAAEALADAARAVTVLCSKLEDLLDLELRQDKAQAQADALVGRARKTGASAPFAAGPLVPGKRAAIPRTPQQERAPGGPELTYERFEEPA